jgi:hypothetical protein
MLSVCAAAKDWVKENEIKKKKESRPADGVSNCSTVHTDHHKYTK